MTTSDSFDDDGDEYELEPVDPEILEMERQRIRESARRAELAVDINETYEDVSSADPVTWDDFKGFRFTIRHLLIATAVLAMALTLIKVGSCLGAFIIAVAALAAGWYFVIKKERRIAHERERDRDERRRQLHDEQTESVDYSQFDEPEEETVPAVEFRFAFSMRQLLGAMTVAAVVFALMSLLGENNAALCLGLLALFGLVVHIIGFELPPLAILCWWLILVLYVIVSLIAVFMSDGDAAAAVISLPSGGFC